MKIRQRVSVAVLAVATLTAALTGCASGGGEASHDDPIIVGAFAGTTGPASLTVGEVVKGWQLGFDEINAAGGINGREIKFVIENDEYDPAKAVAAVRKLVERDKAVVVTGVGTPSVLAVRDYLTSKNVPDLFPIAGSAELYKPPTSITFMAAPSYVSQGRLSAAYGFDNLNVTKLAIINLDQEAGGSFAQGCKAQAESQGIEVTSEAQVAPDATDFKPQLAAAKSSGADGVCLGLTIETTGLLVKQATELGWAPQWLGFIPQANPALPELAGPGAEGTIAATPLLPPGSTDPAATKFAKALDAKFPGSKPGYYNEYGYFAAYMIADALKDAGDEVTSQSVIDAVLAWKDHADPSGLGGPVTFGPDQPNGLNSLYIVQLKGTSFDTLETLHVDN